MRKTASEEKARKGTGMIPALPLGDLSPEKNQNTREMRNNKKKGCLMQPFGVIFL